MWGDAHVLHRSFFVSILWLLLHFYPASKEFRATGMQLSPSLYYHNNHMRLIQRRESDYSKSSSKHQSWAGIWTWVAPFKPNTSITIIFWLILLSTSCAKYPLPFLTCHALALPYSLPSPHLSSSFKTWTSEAKVNETNKMPACRCFLQFALFILSTNLGISWNSRQVGFFSAEDTQPCLHFSLSLCHTN